MTKNLLKAIAVLLLAFNTVSALSQSFTGTYPFTSVTTTTGTTDPTTVPSAPGVGFGSFVAVGTPANPNASSRFSFTEWSVGASNGSDVFTGAINTAEYYEVTLTPQSGFTIDLSSIKFTLQRSGTGIRQYAVRSSIDGYVNNLTAGIAPANANLQVVTGNIFQVSDGATTAQTGSTVTLSGFTALSTAVTFRFYGWNAEATTGTFSIDDVVFEGAANSSGTPVPTIAVNPSVLSFPPTLINTESASQTYVLTAANLTDPVLIAVPAPFLISTTELGTYTTGLSFTPAELAGPVTLYVKFAPTTAGIFTGDSIANSTTGAFDMEGVYVSGEGIDPAGPALGIDQTSIVFAATGVGSSSASSSYILTANNLTADVTVSTTGNFTVSTDNISFSSSLNIVQTDPALATGKTIYVRFVPAAPGALAGTVKNESTGALTRTINTSGTGLSLIDIGAAASPYVQNFNAIAGGLPLGLSVRTGATASALGTTATYNAAPSTWAATSGAFKNFASGNNDQGDPQNTATDRAIGVRQIGSFGDPGASFVFQVANTTGKINFTLDFKLQSLDAASARSTTWRVDYGLGINPSSFVIPATTGNLVTGGNTYSNNSIHVDFGNALDNLTDIVTIRVSAISGSTGSGSRASTGIDDFNLSWEDPSAKTISLSTTAVNFATTNTGASSVSTYTIVKQTNLDQPVIVTATAPFTVSEDGTTYGSSISIPQGDAFNKTIYVKFSPVSVGVFNGTVTNTSTGAISKTVKLSAESINPAALAFDFNTCSISSIPGSGFLSINVTGAQKWGCSQYGRTSTNGVDVNGFSGGAAQTNDAWLISPAINLNTIANIPVLSFYSRGEFTGNKLQLYVSTTYDGSSVPVLSDWTELNGNFPTPPGSAITSWTFSDNIDLTPYKAAAKIYLAFRYTSSTAAAARWSVDDIAITDQTSLVSASPNLLSFGEVSVGASSASQAVDFRALGSVDITLTPPPGYELSTDDAIFTPGAIVINQATAAVGTTVYVRFTPLSKALKVEGNVIASATGLNKMAVSVTGSSYPKSETFDAACYNVSFFGSNSNNNATSGEIATQVANISTVMQRLNMDVIGIEEMSNDNALTQLVANLPGYASVMSNRWSYSFDPPDPDFPPQKIGFIYNTSTMALSATEPPRVMFESMYDSARLNLPGHRLTDYPTGQPSSFWASGRLPYMATFNATINGETKKVRLIVLHAKSGGNEDGYVRRQYDVKLLKDSLDAYYATDNVIILGDYNDRMVTSIYAGNPSSYLPFINDNINYNILTLPLDQAGRTSFPTGTGMIDHITVSNELVPEYISTSTDIEDARAYIPGYNATTGSDHLPVFARFSFQSIPLPVRLTEFNATPVNNTVVVSWTTATELNNSHFIVERSAGGVNNFVQIGRVNGNGNSSSIINYSLVDQSPAAGNNYYRLKQVDIDGRIEYSDVVLVRFGAAATTKLLVYPNPVSNHVTLNLNGSRSSYIMKVNTADGRLLFQSKGTISQLNTILNNRITAMRNGVYILQLNNEGEVYTSKLIKQ